MIKIIIRVETPGTTYTTKGDFTTIQFLPCVKILKIFTYVGITKGDFDTVKYNRCYHCLLQV